MLSLIFAATLTLTPAHADSGWSWTDDIIPHWRTASLQWAHDIHPDHPSFQYLEDYVTPPPDEPWCHDPPDPTWDDCDVFDGRLDDWLYDYLDIPSGQPLPPDLIPYPWECSSICAG